MERIASGFGDVVHHRTGIAAVLSAEVVGDDLEFLDCVLITEEDLRAGDGIVVIGLAIDLEIIRPSALAIHGKIVAIGIRETGRMRAHHAGNQFCDCIKSVVQGNILQRLRVKSGCDLGVGGLQQRGGRSVYFHLGGGRGQRQTNGLKTGRRAGIDLNRVHGRWSERRSGNSDCVLPDRHRIQRELAGRS